MKIDLIITIVVSLICSFSNVFYAQNNIDGKSISSFKYEKLKKQDAERFLKLETKTHYAGAVTFYTYSPENRIHKETSYENRKGEFVFQYERGDTYDVKDYMIYNYQYSELPDYKYPELIERKYLYPSDSVTIEIQTIGKEQTDSTFTMVQKNNFDLITKQTEYSTRTYQGYSGIDQSKIVTYSYGNKNELLQEIKIDLKFGDTLTTNYKYDNGKLIQKIYTDENMQRVQTYKDDLLISSDEKILDRASKTLYSYNDKGEETLSQKFENGKLVYSYKTKYNSKGLKMIYEMQDEVDRENVSYWLYEYDEQGRLAYHINLFKKITRPQKAHLVHEVRPK